MQKKVISVTEAARNFADCVNRAHYQNVTFVLLRNGTPLARIVPERILDEERICTGRSLAAALRETQLSSDEAKSWRHDLHSSRKKLKSPVD
jgi:antitoxin (DNA-binding transcriptional repressor) of toxin-antitoxin stability system